MKLYYIKYEEDGENVVEVFSSRKDTEIRIREMKKDFKGLQKEWQAYIISGNKGMKPEGYVRPPETIYEKEYEVSKDGVISAFRDGLEEGLRFD